MADDTPMMRQYKQIKAQHEDSVLLFRMGDFYEMFYRDAQEVSRLLNLTLTKRQGVPMAGIPYHALQNYLRRLLQAGKRAAICEQTEVPNKSAPGLTKREVVEVVSPGTILHQDLLEDSANNYLQAFGQKGMSIGMALLDFSTGEFRCESFSAPDGQTKAEVIGRELLLAAPRELLVMEALHEEYSEAFWAQGAQQNAHAGGGGAVLCSRIPAWCFDNTERKLCEFFAVQSLKGFGITEEHTSALGAAWVILEYLQQHQKQSRVLAHVRRLLPLRRSEHLQLDSAALRNLEVFKNMQSGGREHTLFGALHECQSPMGSRCLQHWLRYPLRSKSALEQRYDKIDALLQSGPLRGRIREALGGLCDLERITSRITSGRANARDLVALRDSLALGCGILQAIEPLPRFGDMLQTVEQGAQTGGRAVLTALHALLQKALLDHPPVVIHEGGMIQSGYSSELDELRALHGQRKQILDSYVEREQEQIGKVKLKLKYNRIIGYHFEITKAQLAQGGVPAHFIARQTITSGVRYTTEELAEIEERLRCADEQLTQLERTLFEGLLERIQPDAEAIVQLSGLLATLDVLCGFAELAQRYNYTRPTLLESGKTGASSGGTLQIEGGRHPVIEQAPSEQGFVPNRTQLGGTHTLALITGPNMAGKSTYLRQNALIVLMAQSGCFVSATGAQIPLVDQIFCRVGASDNLSRGESTFMVEMQETARILNTASKDSLVIMDEVGRGTSTRDGLAIAQSICEYLLRRICCKALFATHYHELTHLREPRLKLLCLAVEENGAEIRFLKHVREGAIQSSYGVHVARLAGVPREVAQRAQEILEHIGTHPPAIKIPQAEPDKRVNTHKEQTQAEPDKSTSTHKENSKAEPDKSEGTRKQNTQAKPDKSAMPSKEQTKVKEAGLLFPDLLPL